MKPIVHVVAPLATIVACALLTATALALSGDAGTKMAPPLQHVQYVGDEWSGLTLQVKSAPKPHAPPPPVQQVQPEICAPLQDVLVQIHHLLPITGLSEVPADKKDAVYAWAVKQLATQGEKLDGQAKDYDFLVIAHGAKGYGVLAAHKANKTACAAVYAGNDAEFLQITGLPATGTEI